jgi:hypothetical protein
MHNSIGDWVLPALLIAVMLAASVMLVEVMLELVTETLSSPGLLRAPPRC